MTSKTSKIVMSIAALIVILSGIIALVYWSYMRGFSNAANTLEAIGDVQIRKTEAASMLVRAMNSGEINANSGDEIIYIVDMVLSDFVFVFDSIPDQKGQRLCAQANNEKVAQLLKAEKYFGRKEIEWEQHGVRSFIAKCHL